MIEISKELFYKIISDNKLDVVVSAHFSTDTVESKFNFRDGSLFGKHITDRHSPYPHIERSYISEFYYQKYNVENYEDITSSTQKGVVQNDREWC